MLNFVVVFLILVDRIKCYDYFLFVFFIRKEEVEEFCWIDFFEVINYSNVWVLENSFLYKLFFVLLIGEFVCVFLFIIFWYWCYGWGIIDDVNFIIDYVNCLIDVYLYYDRGRYLIVLENLYNYFDNYL